MAKSNVTNRAKWNEFCDTVYSYEGSADPAEARVWQCVVGRRMDNDMETALAQMERDGGYTLRVLRDFTRRHIKLNARIFRALRDIGAFPFPTMRRIHGVCCRVQRWEEEAAHLKELEALLIDSFRTPSMRAQEARDRELGL